MLRLWYSLIFVGYSFNKYKIPQSPLILASILGSMMENNWTQSMKFADGSLSVFVTRPLSCGLLILSIIFIGLPPLETMEKKA